MYMKQILVKFYFSTFFLLLLSCGGGTSKSGFIRINDTDIYYKTIGEGEPILVLHGGPGLSMDYFFPHFDDFARHYKLIFFDQRYSGRSGGIIDSNLTTEIFVDDIEALRKELQIKDFHLMGHSWGGFAALSYAVKYPKNLKSLLLISPLSPNLNSYKDLEINRSERFSETDQKKLDEILASDEFIEGDSPTLERFWKIVFKVYLFEKELINQVDLQVQAKNAKSPFILFDKLYPTIDSVAMFNQLKKFNKPTLIIHGDYDPLPYKYSNELALKMKNAKFELLNNCGHFPFVEKKDKFFSSISLFINSVK